jgi:hypothetical protein
MAATTTAKPAVITVIRGPLVGQSFTSQDEMLRKFSVDKSATPEKSAPLKQ